VELAATWSLQRDQKRNTSENLASTRSKSVNYATKSFATATHSEQKTTY